ncbi:MAG TPA: PEP-CTERM sorting domain-containing protein [Verrucomicrobiae bacterium]|nr:PEP-CTERM sorting domain-containing protein [Verrucomicrobiae bacterium]
MKVPKKPNLKTVLICTLVAEMINPLFAQGLIVIQHAGATDPLTEGFVGTSSGGHPVINDMGVNAWATPDNATNGWSTVFSDYTYILTSQQLTEAVGAGWIFSANLRIATTNGGNATFCAALNLGSEGYFRLYFGSTITGDPFVEAVNYGPGSPTNIIAQVTLTGAGSTYNNYQLVYDASARTASLWINGSKYVKSIALGQPNYGGAVYWGCLGAQEGYAQANWNSVSLEIVPEPSSLSLLFLGGGLLLYDRRNRKILIKTSI